MSGHTPGPWTHRATTIGADYAFMVIGPKLPEGGNPVIADVCIRYDQIADANARLIAAAPELLAALQTLAAKWQDDSWIFDQDEMASIACAAIAKATGSHLPAPPKEPTPSTASLSQNGEGDLAANVSKLSGR